MSTNRALERSYASPLVGHGYDTLSWLLYRPVGGLSQLREQALDAVGVRRSLRVLELGCGTGGVTRRLLARGASVTAVDWSEPMLRIARRRAPLATFVRSELTSYEPAAEFDLVLLAFVLHELSPDARHQALGVAQRALAPNGTLAVVDHAEPTEGLVPRALYRFMHLFEPASMSDWARSGFAPELERAGFRTLSRTALAQGTALAVLARPEPVQRT